VASLIELAPAVYAEFKVSLASQAFEAMCQGRMLADVVTVIGSIDIVAGEVEG
jgi:NADH:ubiquinone oxidoreductase subunit D